MSRVLGRETGLVFRYAAVGLALFLASASNSLSPSISNRHLPAPSNRASVSSCPAASSSRPACRSSVANINRASTSRRFRRTTPRGSVPPDSNRLSSNGPAPRRNRLRAGLASQRPPAAGTASPTRPPHRSKTTPKTDPQCDTQSGPISSLQPKLATTARPTPPPRPGPRPIPTSFRMIQVGKPRPQARCPRHPAHHARSVSAAYRRPRNCNFQNRANQGNKRAPPEVRIASVSNLRH